MMRVIGLFILSVVCLAMAADDAVTVLPAEAVLERREFDPAQPPADMPPLARGEQGYTSWQYTAALEADYAIISDQPRGKGRLVVLKVVRVRMKVGAKYIIYLPAGANEQLKAHEEGHRLLADHYYKIAQATAGTMARPAIGQVLRVEGADKDAAIHAGTVQLVDRVCTPYLKATKDSADRANAIYDELTDHGRRAEPTAGEAVKAAIEKAGREASTKDTKDTKKSG